MHYRKLILIKVKKALSILLLLVYMSTAFGIGIDCHYCGGHLSNVAIAGFGHAQCNCSSKDMQPGCCKNELHFCKTDDHKTQAATIISSFSVNINVPVSYIQDFSPQNLLDKELEKVTDASQKKNNAPPLFIQIRNLRI